MEICNEDILEIREDYFVSLLQPYYNRNKNVLLPYINEYTPELVNKIKNTLIEGYRSGRIVSLSKQKVKIYSLEGEYLRDFNSITEFADSVNRNVKYVSKLMIKGKDNISGFQVRKENDNRPILKIN